MILSKILFVDFSLLKHNLESLFKLNSVLDLNFNYRKKCYRVKKSDNLFSSDTFLSFARKRFIVNSNEIEMVCEICYELLQKEKCSTQSDSTVICLSHNRDSCTG